MLAREKNVPSLSLSLSLPFFLLFVFEKCHLHMWRQAAAAEEKVKKRKRVSIRAGRRKNRVGNLNQTGGGHESSENLDGSARVFGWRGEWGVWCALLPAFGPIESEVPEWCRATSDWADNQEGRDEVAVERCVLPCLHCSASECLGLSLLLSGEAPQQRHEYVHSRGYSWTRAILCIR